MSPLQFQKQLRLHAARQRMLTSEVDAASAAFEVGYESPSQFNREYRRFFYLLGHLTAMHDRMFPLLGIGERLHTELDEPHIAKSGPRACRSTLGNRTYESMGRG